MAMLAEQRSKRKWTLNPRGKYWSEDSNKYGQKMLEKMGWTSGSGLGKHEQGTTKHVHLQVKNDTAGLGYNISHLDKAWTEHQDSFNDFLQKLQVDQDNVVQTERSKSDLSGKSLELKSKQSRTRVHYQKFTRGKDINKYSSKDLANIFGQKELNINNTDQDKQNNYEDNTDPIGTQDNRGGIIAINGGNMAEYFMKKKQDLSDEADDKKRVRFNDHVEYSTDSVKKKKNKNKLDKFEVENKKAKKKKIYDDSVDSAVSSGCVNEALDVEETSEEVHDNEINESKSKKSKKRKGSRRSNLETIVEIPEEDKEAYEERTKNKRPKIIDNIVDNCEPQENILNKKKKKKKHKEKQEIVIDDKNDAQETAIGETISEINTTLEQEECEEDISKKKKKKKKNKDNEQNIEKGEDISQIMTDVSNVENLEDERTNNCETEGETKPVKVKKKKKAKKDSDVNDFATEIVNVKDAEDVFNKENASNLHENEINEPNRKKHERSVDESVSNDSIHNAEIMEKPVKQRNVYRKTPSNSNRRKFHTSSNHWNGRPKMSKKLISFFHRNSVINFPGSNLKEIKGYGANVQ
ncbi:PIN2/TERF1-interacting telomerase inhibitor 1 [Habropoda laboriosa]|uniref:PIN2/TERF1-interacting telomerase inhibitor 1 n=1 Tax=Habropoda laboriosa TaxID=597456 RepID=A0A0L7QMZ5_9HYME|nr:PIN2/TERF1-interacting telomerase inhibitor 1 [Habropoda laboriosa]